MINNNRFNCREQANFHTCKTVLNCFIREFCSEHTQLFSVDRHTNAYSIRFPASNVLISGVLSHYSEIGEFEYKSFNVDENKKLDYSFLVEVIIRELKLDHPEIIGNQATTAFLEKVDNSFHKMALFLKHATKQQEWDYLSSEQSLLYGHPFHPFPKNTEGFTENEVRKYCPELRTSFQLCYLAVREDIFQEEWVEEERRIDLHEAVYAKARQLLKSNRHNYKILPVHPWQYEHVQTIKAVKNYIDNEKIILLGSIGPTAYPTSSIRTVYVPEMNCNIKLSLNIQITNMMRNNNQEQMRRTLDATNYLLQKECFKDELNTAISYEVGVCSCDFGNDEITKLFTIVYRSIDFDTSCTYVLSSLIETPIEGAQSRLYSMMDRRNIDRWFIRYLEISLLPIVRLADKKGIHFEAHLQNSLLTIKDNMPHAFIIRDLEGVSVDIEKVERDVDINGPLFYEKEEAWARTSYYFIVNHLGSFIHAIAKDNHTDEEHFWNIVRQVLQQEYQKSPNGYIDHLLTAKTFAAKQNMMSCLNGKGEAPSYIPVENIIRKLGSDTYGSTALHISK